MLFRSMLDVEVTLSKLLFESRAIKQALTACVVEKLDVTDVSAAIFAASDDLFVPTVAHEPVDAIKYKLEFAALIPTVPCASQVTVLVTAAPGTPLALLTGVTDKTDEPATELDRDTVT